MTEEKAFTDIESATLEHRQSPPPDSDVKSLRSTSFRAQCVIMLMLITVISLAVGLGVGLKSNSTSSSKAENVSKVSSWPELVGLDAENASAWMKENYPEYLVYVVDYDAYVTEDYDPKRVRIYKAPNGTVYATPKIGR